ncbi:hypothetical protein B296_00041677 [Ensete ventricosum]|uniref:Uncharacterized protein n=1 Tax=Ensete ventricosum TaxID=4639 RepID=A0A426XUG0_ENSVE|nr:hypothetical protein B296_00041677 [Ensete ventricosum]
MVVLTSVHSMSASMWGPRNGPKSARLAASRQPRDAGARPRSLEPSPPRTLSPSYISMLPPRILRPSLFSLDFSPLVVALLRSPEDVGLLRKVPR